MCLLPPGTGSPYGGSSFQASFFSYGFPRVPTLPPPPPSNFLLVMSSASFLDLLRFPFLPISSKCLAKLQSSYFRCQRGGRRMGPKDAVVVMAMAGSELFMLTRMWYFILCH